MRSQEYTESTRVSRLPLEFCSMSVDRLETTGAVPTNSRNNRETMPELQSY